jgi:large subunit ribosomal protein L17
MRHHRKEKHLGRTSSHRKALRRNMASSLFVHGRITTTLTKAKYIRPYVEKLVSIARTNNVNSLRRLIAELDDKDLARMMLEKIGPVYRDRPGGYTRILKLGADANRLGDNAPVAMLELIGIGDVLKPAETKGKEAKKEEATQSAKA